MLKENWKEQQSHSRPVPLGRNQSVFSSHAGRERRNPLEVPSAPSSDVQPFAACSQRSQFALQPAASLSALQGCQTNSVIVLHPVEAEIIKSVFFFSVWLLRSTVQLSAVSICHTDCGFWRCLHKSCYPPCKNGGVWSFHGYVLFGQWWQWVRWMELSLFPFFSFLFALTRGSCVDQGKTQLKSAHQWRSISQIRGAK